MYEKRREEKRERKKSRERIRTIELCKDFDEICELIFRKKVQGLLILFLFLRAWSTDMPYFSNKVVIRKEEKKKSDGRETPHIIYSTRLVKGTEEEEEEEKKRIEKDI